MLIETFTVGMLATNCYVVSDQQTKETVIIDPGLDYRSEADQIFEYVKAAGLSVKFIVNTHGHTDHIHGNEVLRERYRVPICIHPLDAQFIERLQKDGFPANVMLEEGFIIKFGGESLKVIHTPGHTPGSISFAGANLVFTGDTLFAGGIGRTDFPEGSPIDIMASLKKLVALPDYFLVYPGHGPSTIIGEEKRINPFLTNQE